MNGTRTEAIYPSGRQPSIRVVMMPRDTNPLGTIFGGVIMSHIDMAAAIECHHYHPVPPSESINGRP